MSLLGSQLLRTSIVLPAHLGSLQVCVSHCHVCPPSSLLGHFYFFQQPKHSSTGAFLEPLSLPLQGPPVFLQHHGYTGLSIYDFLVVKGYPSPQNL